LRVLPLKKRRRRQNRRNRSILSFFTASFDKKIEKIAKFERRAVPIRPKILYNTFQQFLKRVRNCARFAPLNFGPFIFAY